MYNFKKQNSGKSFARANIHLNNQDLLFIPRKKYEEYKIWVYTTVDIFFDDDKKTIALKLHKGETGEFKLTFTNRTARISTVSLVKDYKLEKYRGKELESRIEKDKKLGEILICKLKK